MVRAAGVGVVVLAMVVCCTPAANGAALDVPTVWYDITRPYHYDEQHRFQAGWNRGVTARVRGQDVMSLSDGRVSFAGRVARTGVISVRRVDPHYGPLIYTYVGVEPGVRVGQRVSAGMPIAVPYAGPMHLGVRSATVRWRYLPLRGNAVQPALIHHRVVHHDPVEQLTRPVRGPAAYVEMVARSLERIVSGEVMRLGHAVTMTHPLHRFGSSDAVHTSQGQLQRPDMFGAGSRANDLLHGWRQVSVASTSVRGRRMATVDLPRDRNAHDSQLHVPVREAMMLQRVSVATVATHRGVAGLGTTGMDVHKGERVTRPQVDGAAHTTHIARSNAHRSPRAGWGVGHDQFPAGSNPAHMVGSHVPGKRSFIRSSMISAAVVLILMLCVRLLRRARRSRGRNEDRSLAVVEQFVPAGLLSEMVASPVPRPGIRASMRRRGSDWVDQEQEVLVDQLRRHTV